MNICFTGHRPNKLFGYDLNDPKYIKLYNKIINTLINICNTNNDTDYTFYFGGALGIDQLAFSCIEYIQFLEDGRKIKNNIENTNNVSSKIINIKLILAIPFEKQYIKWQTKDIQKWKSQCNRANEIIYVDTLEKYKARYNPVPVGDYHPSKMQLRNIFMVDNSDILIAVWNGDTKGGTYNCIKYAQKQNKNIIVIDPNNI